MTFDAGLFDDGDFDGNTVVVDPPVEPDPVIDVQAAKADLRAQIQKWRSQGKSWGWIETGEGTLVWSAYVKLGGK